MKFVMVLVMLPLLLRCDSLMSMEGKGDPLFSFDGRITQTDDSNHPEEKLRVSLFWAPGGETRVPLDQLKEQKCTVDLNLPANFTMHIFETPLEEHLVDNADYGIALILIYVDKDGNDRLTLDNDELVGGATRKILIYARKKIDAQDAPFLVEIPKGFSLASIPTSCQETWSYPRPGDDCGVPVGQACTEYDQCGSGGMCLTSFDLDNFPQGYCTFYFEDEGCVSDQNLSIGLTYAMLIKKCTSDADCNRSDHTCHDFPTTENDGAKGCWPNLSTAAEEYVVDSWYRGLRPTEDCGSKLGLPCSKDSDCDDGYNPGICLRQRFGVEFVDGYCSSLDAGGCYPHSLLLQVREAYWFKGCNAPSQCRDNYDCDTYFRACWPAEETRIMVFDNFNTENNIEPFCLH